MEWGYKEDNGKETKKQSLNVPCKKILRKSQGGHKLADDDLASLPKIQHAFFCTAAKTGEKTVVGLGGMQFPLHPDCYFSSPASHAK